MKDIEGGLCLIGIILIVLVLGFMGYLYVMVDGIDYYKFDFDDKIYEFLLRNFYVCWI